MDYNVIKDLVICFGILMSIFPTISFLVYANLKNLSFVRPFFLGIFLYIMHFIFNLYFVKFIVKNVYNLNVPADVFICEVLPLFLSSLFIFMSRIWAFYKIFNKTSNLFFSAISLSVGYCTLFNIFNCGIFRIVFLDIFSEIRTRILFFKNFHNFWVIINDSIYSLVIFYVLKKNFKYKSAILAIVFILDYLNLYISHFILIRLPKWYYEELYLISTNFIFLIFCFVLYKKYKKDNLINLRV